MPLNTAYGTVLYMLATHSCYISFLSKSSWRASLLCFDLWCEWRGRGEWGESSNWYTLTHGATIQRVSKKIHVYLHSWVATSRKCVYPWLCVCVTRQCWWWEFLSSDTNVSAVHPVDWRHVEADGTRGPPASWLLYIRSFWFKKKNPSI